jgi:PTH2 family peptidyl-tRNA hydrolase
MKQVIIIRKDLKMRRGKECAQSAHASMSFLLKSQLSINDKKVLEWINSGQTKICLQANSEQEILDLHKKALSLGLISNYITDAGRTEFNGIPTITTLAIGPNKSEDIDKVTKHLKLY